MSNNMPAKTKEELVSEISQIEEMLADIAVFDPESKRWQAVPEQFEQNEADENDKADRAEEFELRGAKVMTLQKRLDDIQEQLEQLQ